MLFSAFQDLKFPLVISLITWFSFFSTSYATAAGIADAERYYAAGNYEAAKNLLFREIEKVPSAATPHYLLGNIFFQQKQYGNAIKAYSTATQLEPASQAGELSRRAIEKMTQHARSQESAIKPVKIEFAPGTEYAGYTVIGGKVIKTSNSAPTAGTYSAQAITSSVNARSQQLSSECDAKINELLKEKDLRLISYTVAKDQQLQENKAKQARNPAFNATENNDLAMQDFYARKFMIENETERRCADLRTYYRTSINVTQGKSSNSAALSVEGQNSNIKLVPLGSNMFTHNYQTVSQPSGASVPLKAAPAKSLQSP